MGRFYKMAYFISCKKINDTINSTNSFFKLIMRLDGYSRSITLHRDYIHILIFKDIRER